MGIFKNEVATNLNFVHKSEYSGIQLFFLRKPVLQRRDVIFPPRFQPTTDSPSLQKASFSNPCPLFSNCIQNDVTSVRRSKTGFRKKTIVYHYIHLY